MVSIDALIFARPVTSGLRECLRVLKPGGRLVYTGWDPREHKVFDDGSTTKPSTATSLGAAGVTNFVVHDRPDWLTTERAKWSATLAIPDDGDPFLAAARAEATSVLEHFDRKRRFLAVAIAPLSPVTLRSRRAHSSVNVIPTYSSGGWTRFLVRRSISSMRRILTVLAALLIMLVSVDAGWPTDHGDNLRSGNAASAAAFKKFSTSFSRTLDGAVYGSPIMAGGNLIVATENNTVYALNPTTGAVKWSRHLRSPIKNTGSVLACPGNIDPTGITSTPAYDSVTNRIFVVTVTYNASTGVTHELWGLNPTTGAVGLSKRVEVPGTDSKAEQQRSALAVDRGNVYIGFGGLTGDCGNYKGAVIAIKANGALGGQAYIVPTPREGAVWAPGGPVVAPNGHLFFAVGNGESTSAYDYSDSVTEVDPYRMKRVDFFAPSTWATDNQNDLDLGSLTPAYTSAGYILQVGKSGVAYTAKIGHLGGIGGQVSKGTLCKAFGVSAVTGSSVYLPCTTGIVRVDVFSNGTFIKRWTSANIPGSPIAGPGALYALSGGNLYALDRNTGKALASVAVGTTTRFATPMLVGNLIYVGTTTGIVAKKVA